MTPEQQRELWLKRLLPMLGVLVVYFAILSSFITDKSKKAEGEYKTLVTKGIDASSLPAKQQELEKLNTELEKLAADEKALRDGLASNNGFLAGKESQNDSLDKISAIFAAHNLKILEENRLDNANLTMLSKSFVDIQKSLQALTTVAAPAVPVPTSPVVATASNNLNLWTIEYHGSYNDTYRALTALLDSKIKALPVALTMQLPNSETNTPLKWQLTLWL